MNPAPKKRGPFDGGPDPFLVDEEETCRCGHHLEEHATPSHRLTACGVWDCLCPSFVEGDFDEL